MDREYSDRFLEVTGSAATADSQAPESVLHTAFAAIMRADYDAFGRSVTDDVELSIRGMGAMDGSWRGRDEVVAAARNNFGMLADQNPEIESIISDGDRIAVLLRETGRYKASGETYTMRGVQWFTFANGKIRKIDEIIAPHP
jgi:ketosteroid isomerase-like protein